MHPDELTRRAWVLRLAATTVLTGLSGSDVLEGAPELPPGLYAPSVDHFAHAMKAAQAPLPPDRLQFFAPADFTVVQHLTALILGEQNDTPPVPEVARWIDLIVASSADVQKAARALSAADRNLAIGFFGERSVREMEETDAQALCRTGLTSLGGPEFLKLSEAEQLSMLESMQSANDPFLKWFKARVQDGFYTSKEGLKELDYKGNSFYAESPGCEHQQI